MVYIITKQGKVGTFGKGKDAFATKTEAKRMLKEARRQHPKMKGISIKKLKLKRR